MNVCFIELNAYPLLTQKSSKVVTGPTVRVVLLAEELAKKGFQVSIIVYSHDEVVEQFFHGVRIIRAYRRSSGRIVKGFSLLDAMIKADADLYIHYGAVEVSLFAKLLHKKSLLDIASDAYVLREVADLENKEFYRRRLSIAEILHTIDIRFANSIIVQNKRQQKLLKCNYNRDSTLIKMPIRIIENDVSTKINPPIILWVGAMANVKQPQIFLELCGKIINAQFIMIGGCTPENESLYNIIKSKSKNIPNLKFLGAVPFNEVTKYFEKASIVVNTSKFEGFPNVFLQAWLFHCPVVSLNADPDELLCVKQLGYHSKSLNKMTKDILNLLENPNLRLEIGLKSNIYVKKTHDIATIINAYAQAITHVQ